MVFEKMTLGYAANTNPMNDIPLPPLPPAAPPAQQFVKNWRGAVRAIAGPAPGIYTAEQMRAFATEALQARGASWAQTRRPTEDDVTLAYQVLLGRPPESPAVIAGHTSAVSSLPHLLRNIVASAEFAQRLDLTVAGTSPLAHFNACIDVRGIIEAHVQPNRAPRPHHIVNFLGVAIPTKVMGFLENLDGGMDPVPIPGNFHADMSEWAGALRAVDLAQETFTMIELGCGWACWMTNTGVAARSRRLRVNLIGIEGDPTHLSYARETLEVNGFDKNEYRLISGIAAAGTGYALFPKREHSAEHWGFEPVFGATPEESEAAVASGKFERMTMVPLSEAIGEREKIDLLHMDIQGGEADLVAATLDLLSERVAYLVIGTHSRQLEGRLMDLLIGAGWALEVERPAIFNLPKGTPEIDVDGVQAWRNRKFNA
jgi:hypothetical protein